MTDLSTYGVNLRIMCVRERINAYAFSVHFKLMWCGVVRRDFTVPLLAQNICKGIQSGTNLAYLWKSTEATTGLPRWSSGKEPTCQCKRHKFDPWIRKSLE